VLRYLDGLMGALIRMINTYGRGQVLRNCIWSHCKNYISSKTEANSIEFRHVPTPNSLGFGFRVWVWKIWGLDSFELWFWGFGFL
jgi:hypothetical protein